VARPGSRLEGELGESGRAGCCFDRDVSHLVDLLDLTVELAEVGASWAALGGKSEGAAGFEIAARRSRRGRAVWPKLKLEDSEVDVQLRRAVPWRRRVGLDG